MKSHEGPRPQTRQDLYPGIFERAEAATRRSRLPGWRNGPADAFRHIVASAEMARRYGSPIAKVLGEAHELRGSAGGQPAEEAAMDRHNNNIGIAIGRDATSFDDVVARAKARISDAFSGRDLKPVERPKWLAPQQWINDPDRADEDQDNWPPAWTDGRAGGADRILARPVEEWSPEDVRTIQSSRTYLRDGPGRDAAFAKVRDWYARGSAAKGGSVAVRAYARADGTKVDAHSRAAPQAR